MMIRSRPLRAVLAVAVALAGGCGGRRPVAVDGGGGADGGAAPGGSDALPPGIRVTEQAFAPGGRRELDLLFVVINSTSTDEEQEALGRAFPALLAALDRLPAGPPDLHVGVVSSDLGAGPTTFAACRPGGDRAVFRAGENRGCGLRPGDRFLVPADPATGRPGNFAGDLGQVFSCLVALSSLGCPYEHHLEAARRALDLGLTPENRGFLRADAHLGIVILSDDDDCSADPAIDIIVRDPVGVNSGTVCARMGHECNGGPLPAGEFSAPLASCRAAAGGSLLPVAELVQAIRASKSRPDQQITVAGIFGRPADLATATYRMASHGGVAVNLDPVCRSPLGTANAGLRLEAFVAAFGGAGMAATVCEGDLSGTARAIGERLVTRMTLPCLVFAPADLDPAPGPQDGCEVIERRPAGGGGDRVIAPCARAGSRPCWRLEGDERCADTMSRLDIEAGGDAAPAGTTYLLRCPVCVAAGDLRCARRR